MFVTTREIALFNLGYKVLATIIKNRMAHEMEKVLSEYLNGFRGGSSVEDQISTLTEIQP